MLLNFSCNALIQCTAVIGNLRCSMMKRIKMICYGFLLIDLIIIQFHFVTDLTLLNVYK
jgi:hypothetical protein